MKYILENDKLQVVVNSFAAELQGIRSKATGLEYMWQPGAEIWNNRSILLFPNPGRIAHDRIIVGGKVYPATMHGFAKDMEFTVEELSDERIVLELAANDDTRFYFPYEFLFRVTFELKGDVLEQRFDVVNKDNKDMYFCLGAHPGFYCPIELGESGDDYVLRFDPPQQMLRTETEAGTRLLTGKTKPVALENGTDMFVGEKFFNDDPKLFSNVKADTITLLSKKSGRFMEMGIKDFPYMCIWGVPDKMQILSIEPWCGTSDLTDTDHVWEHKLGIEKAEIGDTWTRSLTFRVG